MQLNQKNVKKESKMTKEEFEKEAEERARKLEES